MSTDRYLLYLLILATGKKLHSSAKKSSRTSFQRHADYPPTNDTSVKKANLIFTPSYLRSRPGDVYSKPALFSQQSIPGPCSLSVLREHSMHLGFYLPARCLDRFLNIGYTSVVRIRSLIVWEDMEHRATP
ncbi:hypothetical protein M441DRAFT_352386 [Trichoderma asperellum CBS 433.97]|uniref:Uncharacterized protein n=1 Tax=Trichoderma asperellum (strain ATCC 204424 / CBS 433.97 / NBRC 101777) TaxID=1042311 RepID=A0A2T3ZII8_TRIA4|nr:hypothetical protein M441DRAFT_352386 [Trichoderma asperellum CBS 433.97]PTB44617.1 hypothetical protein M441DRAFT_352386 [Trichoderma asperellum CBS 433.97]